MRVCVCFESAFDPRANSINMEEESSTDSVEEEDGSISMASMFKVEDLPHREKRQMPNGDGIESKDSDDVRTGGAIYEGSGIDKHCGKDKPFGENRHAPH